MVTDIVYPDKFLAGNVLPDNERVFIYDMQVPFRSSGVLRELEHIGIFPDQVLKHILFAVDLACASVDVVQRPDVVKATSVVLVVVGEQNGI